jgi:histo-blood group ABO system transferase
MSTTLVTVVNGEIYEKFAEDLFSSAEEFFHPTEKVEFLMLPGRPGWPDATMYRYHVLRDHMPDSDYVFMSDADMLFESEVGPEILPRNGVTATLHPGYVTRTDFPYEKREGMWTRVAVGTRYFCGGFVGGTQSAMAALSSLIARFIDHDVDMLRTPLWHDESALNALLAHLEPEVILTPSYCYPDDDSWYLTQWKQTYKRKLVALDKTKEQRGDR